MRLRSHVLIIAGATILPLCVFVCVMMFWLFQKGRDSQIHQLVETTRALSLAVDRDFEVHLSALRTLATSEHLRSGDLRRFHEAAKRARAVYEGAESIALIDRSGQQVVNTRLPFGAALPRAADPEFVRKIINGRTVAVSNLVTSAVLKRPTVIIGVPVTLDGERRFALTFGLSPRFLQHLLESQNIPTFSLATIVDANKVIIASSKEIDRLMGQPVTPLFAAKSTETREGFWIGHPDASERAYIAHHRSAFSDWTVGLAVAKSRVDAALWNTLGIAVGGFLVLLAMVAALALVFGRRIVSSIGALFEGAKQLGAGEVLKIDPLPIIELDQVRRELISAAAQRKQTENQLRYEFQLMRAISDKAAEAIFVVDKRGRVTFVNPEGERTFGFSRAEFIGQLLHDKIHHHYPDGRPMPRSECTLARMRAAGNSMRAREDLFFHKDGSPVLVTCTNAPIEVEGERVGAVLIARDVTAAKRADEALRKSEAGLAEAQERAKLGSWERDLATGLGSWSAEMFRLFERDAADGVPALGEFFELLEAEDRARVRDAMKRAVDTGVQTSAEFRSNPLRGPVRHYSSTIYAMANSAGKVVRLAGTVQDITERRDAEKAVRESEERLKLAMAASHLGAWERNVTTDEIYWSPECRAIVGVENFDGTRAGIRNLMHPEDAQRTLEAADLAIANRTEFAAEFRIIRSGGGLVWLAARAITQYDESGRPQRVIGTLQDITRRKRADDALKEQAARLNEQAKLLDLAHDTVIVRDLDGTITFWNRGASEMYGWTAEEARGRLVHELLQTEFPRPRARIEKELVEKERWEGELIHVRRDGARIIAASRWALQRNLEGLAMGVMEINYDVTERKAAEEALRQSEERLKLALAATRMGAWDRNAQTGEVFWSPECYEIFGIRSFGDTRENYLQLVHPEDIDRLTSAVDRASVDGTEFEAEFRIIRPGGEVVWISHRGRTLCDDSGRPLRVIGTMQDITERKRLLAEVERRAEQLAEADRRKDEFLATLAHELRNPLAPIMNAVEILRLNGPPTPDFEWVTGIIEKQLQHMTRLIDDLLDVSRITRNKLDLRKERVDLSQVVQMAVDTTAPVIEQFRHSLALELPLEPIYLNADPVRLAQVFSNLLNNAAKYTDPGGSISIAIKRVGNTVAASIRDNGIGIPKDRLNDIFELFSQIDPLLERSRGGLGIGLNLALRLAEMHEGSLEARSEGPGTGSEFVLRLPIGIDEAISAGALLAAPGIGSNPEGMFRPQIR